MATDEPVGPDLQAGIPGTDLAEGAMLQGHVGGEQVLLVRRAAKVFAVVRSLHPLSRPLADGLVGERHRALSLASCLFRSCHRRSAACARHRSARLLAGGTARRQDLRRRKSAGSAAAARHQQDAPGKIVIRAAARPVSPRPRRLRRDSFDGKHRDGERGRCAARSTGPICPRTIWRAMRRRNGCRCAPTSSMPKTGSICAGARCRRHRPRARRWRWPMAAGCL